MIHEITRREGAPRFDPWPAVGLLILVASGTFLVLSLMMAVSGKGLPW